MAEFQFIVNGELVTYDSWENIPEEFEHVIKFIPDVPPDPHTEDEHAEMEIWNTRLQQLLEKERARSN
jgi:hypothetical protein|tara:strand:- start:75 stop:278 length:204 start_codon:yes stop_codon:yes gene_type:complete